MKPPVDFDLPWDAWRPGQQRAIRVAENAKTKFVVVQAPTGTGKTGIVGGAMKQEDSRAVVLTATKGLQNQYQDVIPWLTDIRGMANYPCLAARDEFKAEFRGRRGDVMCDDGPCKLDVRCSLKDHGCLYFDAYRDFLGARYGLTSYAYWLASHRYGKGLGHVERLYCDEAHTIADQLATACQIRVSHRDVTQRRRPRNIAGWRAWASAQLHDLGKHDTDFESRLRFRTKRERYETLVRSLDRGWAWAVDEHATTFEPIDVRPYAELLWQQARTVTLLSATITKATIATLGIPEDDITFHAVPMSFPVESRPVYCVNGGRIDFRTMADPRNVEWWLKTIDGIIRPRLDRKGIIHTVSYDRQQVIVQGSKYGDRMIAPRNSAELPWAIERFYAAKPGTILISPSIVEGYNFPLTAAEYQILSKLPFPYTQSPIMKARLKAIPRYRELVTAQAIVQAAGRINRSEEDQGETFIIDEHMRWFLQDASEFFPQYFKDALVVTNRLPAPPPRLAA